MKVNSSTLAKQLAEKLDALDSAGKNGKIEASIWNEFVKDKGGKTIKRYINTDTAVKSIVVYLCRQSTERGCLISDLGQEWIDGLNIDGGRTSQTTAERTINTVNADRTSPTAPTQSTTQVNLRPVDTSYSTISRSEALIKAKNDSRLEELNGGSGWRVATESFITDIPFAKKHTGKILSFVASIIGEEIVVTSALGTAGINGRRSPHILSQSYCTHHNAENPKLDISTNGHSRILKQKLASTGLFSRISIESTHLDIQIKPEVYYAYDRGYNMQNILACAKNNTLNTLIA